MARFRIRQHVNPLSRRFHATFSPPDWSTIYADCDRPLHLDIGCARGRFLLEMAQQHPQINFLGVEIREPLVAEANDIRDQQALRNLHYLFTNINNSLRSLLSSLPEGKLRWVTIQFPDPWFKTRHAKRRVVQPEFVQGLVDALPPGALVFLQSDVLGVATEMRALFQDDPRLNLTHTEPWRSANLFPVPTEREIATLNKGEPVYRVLFEKVEDHGSLHGHLPDPTTGVD